MKKLTLLVMGLCTMGAMAGNNDPLTITPPTEAEALQIKDTKKTTTDAFGQGKVAITAGYGFCNFALAFTNAFQGYAGYKSHGLGPLHVKAEYGLNDVISFGASFNFIKHGASWTEDFGVDVNNNPIVYTYSWDRTAFSILGRMNVHFATSEKVDPYWGIGAGFRSGGWKFDSTEPGYTGGNLSTGTLLPVGFETTLGLRYYFTPNIGAYAEFGIAKSVVQVGLAASF